MSCYPVNKCYQISRSIFFLCFTCHFLTFDCNTAFTLDQYIVLFCFFKYKKAIFTLKQYQLLFVPYLLKFFRTTRVFILISSLLLNRVAPNRIFVKRRRLGAFLVQKFRLIKLYSLKSVISIKCSYMQEIHFCSLLHRINGNLCNVVQFLNINI